MPDLLGEIDRVMASPKTVAGSDVPARWREGWKDQELAATFPLEVEGEVRGSEGPQLLVIGLLNAPGLQFRLGILLRGCICRLDYTDEIHTNSYNSNVSVPPLVKGPHFHSWPLNRWFFRGVSVPPKLHNAVPYSGSGTSFDSILRWFCAETNIEPLPGNHRIELPIRTRLL